jgi:hypothetical protein
MAAAKSPVPTRQTTLAAGDFVFGDGRVTIPKGSFTFARGDELARIVTGDDGVSIEIYSAPTVVEGSSSYGTLRQTMPLERAKGQPAYAALTMLAPGTVAVLHGNGVLGPTWLGHWIEIPVAVPNSVLTNGDETAMLIFSKNGAPLGAGKYTLKFTLSRDRWSASTQADPEQHYSDQWMYKLNW